MERSRCTPYSSRRASPCRHLTSRHNSDLSRDYDLAWGDYEANETIKGGRECDESRLCSPSAIGGVMSIVLDEQ